jgi:two-component system, NarL family, response regulator NreC
MAASNPTQLPGTGHLRMAPEKQAAIEPGDDLSDRERQVLRLVALGHTNAEIAAQLFFSIRTIETHRAHIQIKLGITGRVELVHYALEHDLIGA